MSSFNAVRAASICRAAIAYPARPASPTRSLASAGSSDGNIGKRSTLIPNASITVRRVRSLGSELCQHLIPDLEVAEARQQDGCVVANNRGNPGRPRDAQVARFEQIGQGAIVATQLEFAEPLEAQRAGMRRLAAEHVDERLPRVRVPDPSRTAVSRRTSALPPNRVAPRRPFGTAPAHP